MVKGRHKNLQWDVPDNSFEGAQLAVQMDIRDALLDLNGLLRCYRIPAALDALAELGKQAKRKRLTEQRKRRMRNRTGA